MKKTDIVLATRNLSKIVQIKAVLCGLPVQILSLNDVGIEGEAIEDGKTLEENARKKALFAWKPTRKFCMAEDTGLSIDCLDGEPGIRAARWAGHYATTGETMRYTLERMQGVAMENRTATFRTVAVVISPDGTESVFSGELRGVILTEPRILYVPNLPYSGIFLPEGQSEVLAEMLIEKINEISHRGKTFRQVFDYFEKILG